MIKHLKSMISTGAFAIALAQPVTVFAQQASDASGGAAGESQDIVVTATRSSEILSKVPISVAVFSQEKLDEQGIKQFSDVIRFTPGLALNEGATGSNDVSIRGISSTAGAATTGIYIDDVPIQVRQIGFAAGSSFPVVFDLERIEILRGPQGTLFGAGSEGGTVRFIQPDPSTSKWSLYGRAEGSVTPKADGSYEAGLAIGGPIVQDKLGFRASAFYRKDGGWIDLVPANLTLIDPTAASGPSSVGFTQTGPGQRNFNDVETMAFRGALGFTPTETLKITPSIFYQQRKTGASGNRFWLSGSDPDRGRFVAPDFSPGTPSATNGLTQTTLPDREGGKAELLVAALEVELDLGFASLYSTTSYLDQKKTTFLDLTAGYEVLYMDQDFARPGAKAISIYQDRQKNFTQELRLQSGDPDARLRWLVGGFFIKSNQRSDQLIEVNTFFDADSFFGIPNLDNADPFGPGFNNFQNVWGAPMIGASGTYSANARSRERQLAGFGQLDFKLTDRITLTAGARYSKNWLRYSLVGGGPENNLNAPFGAPCPTGPVCQFGSGAFAPVYPTGRVRTVEKAFTPKVGVNFQIDDRNLVYASVAKGYRPGGGQIPLPNACNTDLADFGYVDANGNPFTPQTFGSDSVWSYEVGSKNRLFGGLASIAASAYLIKWKNIQTSLFLPVCAYALTDNLGSATVKGFDLTLDIRPIRGLLLNATVGYSHARLDGGFTSAAGTVVLPPSSGIANSGPPWTVVLSGQYEADLSNDMRGYIRGDMTYSSREVGSGNTARGAFNFDPLLSPNPEATVVNSRVGLTRGGYDISLFVNNVFDVAPISEIQRTRYIFTGSTLRPRTIGITFAVRQ